MVTGHVVPDEIPYVGGVYGAPVDPGVIHADAAGLRGLAGDLRSAGEDTVQAWSGITSWYHGPSEEVVWEAMLPVGPATDGMASRSEEVASAVEGFADEITPIVTALTQVKVEAEALVADIEGFTPYTRHDWRRVWEAGLWDKARVISDLVGAVVGIQIQEWDQDPDLIDSNDDLVRRINDQVAQYEQAERRCANRINAVYGGTQWHEYGAGSEAEGVSSSYGWDESALDGSDEPWGAPVGVAESGVTKAILFVPDLIAGVSDGVSGIAGGLLSLVAGLSGVSLEQGTVLDDETGVQVGDMKVVWSWQTSDQTGENLLDTAVGLIMGVDPLNTVGGQAVVPVYDFTTGQWSSPTGGQITTGVGKSVVAWDQWGTDPGEAVGETVVSVGSFLIPGVGVAGKTGDTAKFAEVAGDTAKTLDAAEDAAKLGDTAVDTATVSDATKLAEAETISQAGDAVDTVKATDTTEAVDRFTIPQIDKPVPDSDAVVHPEPEPVHSEPTPGPEPVLHPTPESEPVVTSKPHEFADDGSVTPIDTDGVDANDGRTYQMMDGTDYTTTTAPEQLSDTRVTVELLSTHGVTRVEMIDLVHTPVSELTSSETAVLKEIRGSLPQITDETVFQKVLGQPYIDPEDVLVEDESGNVQTIKEAGTLHLGGADEYILGGRVEYPGGPGPTEAGGPHAVGQMDYAFDDSSARGFVSVADDTSHLTTPADLYDGVRLDYSGTTFARDDSSVYVIRFQVRNPNVVDIPYGERMGGTVDESPPFTGNGFTGARSDIIPEYRFSGEASIRPGAEIWEITNTGNERLTAVFNGKTWIPVMG